MSITMFKISVLIPNVVIIKKKSPYEQKLTGGPQWLLRRWSPEAQRPGNSCRTASPPGKPWIECGASQAEPVIRCCARSAHPLCFLSSNTLPSTQNAFLCPALSSLPASTRKASLTAPWTGWLRCHSALPLPMTHGRVTVCWWVWLPRRLQDPDVRSCQHDLCNPNVWHMASFRISAQLILWTVLRLSQLKQCSFHDR